MGIDKVGDRVRLFLSIKKLRTKAYANQKKRNRVSFVSAHLVFDKGRRERIC
jgi:mitogen-activated protein kinase kinase kinase